MNFMLPDLENLILTFKAYTSSVSSCTTAGTVHAAVRCYRPLACPFPLALQKFLCHTRIDKIPRKQLVQLSGTKRIKADIHTSLRKGFQPSLIVEGVFAT